ncbi:hypothetical protein QCD71_15555 [Sphingomonas sp. PsM26]|nr:hypothetical protein [Sphingomonas sp. PsM26]
MADPTATQAPPALSPEDAQRILIDRIEDALTRIDVATRKRVDDMTRMEQRHDVLRDRMTQAITTLDTVLAAADAANAAEAEAEAEAGADGDAESDDDRTVDKGGDA